MRCSIQVASLLSVLLLLVGCQNRAETVTQQLLGTWSVVGEDDFHVTTTGQRYTFEGDGTLTIRVRRGLGTSGTLRAAYEVGRDGSVTLRDGGEATTYDAAFSGDTLRLTAADTAGSDQTQPRISVKPREVVRKIQQRKTNQIKSNTALR